MKHHVFINHRSSFLLQNPYQLHFLRLPRKMGPNHNSPNDINTIITQLIQIIKEISSFPECKNTSKRLYSNLVRRVKLLSPLFEELVDREDDEIELLPVDQVKSFESLLIVLKSAKDLLKWVQESSKLYQAVQRDKISTEFLHITGKIEEALSKISYNRLGLSEEVQEQIGLVHAQFLRAKARTESSDLQIEMDITEVQDEAEPDAAVLQRLSQNLHLLTMDDLRKESRAFHEMVITSSSDLGDSFEMMSSLFKKLDDYLLTVSPEVDMCDVDKNMIKHRSPIIPDDFRCPISLELMKDPVIVSTGQTYERSCIQKWLDAGHKTCPKTQQTLLHTALTPNYVLKSLITLWCENNGVELPRTQGACRNRRTRNSASNCDKAAIAALLKKLAHGNIEEKRATAGELRLLGKRNADNRVCIAEAGAIPLLVELLSSPDSRTQEHAVTALLNLSINDMNKGIIVNAGAIQDIVEVLKNSSMEARENAAATLFSLSVVDENKVAIGAAGAIPALIDLLIQGTPRGKKDAATAIFNLSIYQGNKVRAVRAGIVDPLIKFLKEVDGGMVDESLAILAILANHPEGKSTIGHTEPIPLLVELIRTGSPRNRENAAAILWSLCMGDLYHLQLAKELQAEQVLKELSENGTDRAKRKASSLLEFLQRAEDVAE
ncbi:U-box domain-containing protein 14-like [Chenopodium quinoa]|uniref:RING-type E3 ubiquitin transferase n=1 Tax=Chenopodium quinoa TaxID=63459 RepID=A0A803NA48_CHEQI|nr:U-box domain-containing protein 14-like [Chenopodium quinoa]